MEQKNFTIGGLCSGVGGIELGFKNAGFEILWANDMDHKAMISYERIIGANHYIGKKAMTIKDALSKHKESIKPVNVVAAGFPCQAFSIAGERKGFDDARGTVVFDIFQLIDELKNHDGDKGPDVIFLENVKNFKSHDKGNTYDRIEQQLYNMGYSVYTKILNTCDYSNIPQNRERTYMICFKGEETWKTYRLHERDNEISDKDLKIIKSECPKTLNFHDSFPKPIPRNQLLFRDELLQKQRPDKKYFYYDNGKILDENGEKTSYHNMLDEFEDNKDTFYQIRRVYVRENKNNMCPTLTANMGTGGHNVPIVQIFSKKRKKRSWRKLTPKECFRFQGYPEFRLPPTKKVSNGQLYKQAGNSVTVPVITRLAEVIRDSLL